MRAVGVAEGRGGVGLGKGTIGALHPQQEDVCGLRVIRQNRGEPLQLVRLQDFIVVGNEEEVARGLSEGFIAVGRETTTIPTVNANVLTLWQYPPLLIESYQIGLLPRNEVADVGQGGNGHTQGRINTIIDGADEDFDGGLWHGQA